MPRSSRPAPVAFLQSRILAAIRKAYDTQRTDAIGQNKEIELIHERRYNAICIKGCSGGLDGIVNDCGYRKSSHRSWYKEMGQIMSINLLNRHTYYPLQRDMKYIIKETFLLFLFVFILIAGCSKKTPVKEVVVYTSLDKVFSEPVLKKFEEKTGIKVMAVYDSEATKTTGLVNRLIAEKDAPKADVFWNSETGRTIVLKQKGVLAPYISPSAADIPAIFKDKDGFWTGFGARCRILIYNKDLIKNNELPKSIFELAEPKWKGKVSLAYPLFGTTATHAAALFSILGKEKAKAYFQSLKDNGIVITDGNASSRDRVADGTVAIGFTDTDDAYVAIEQDRPVDIIWPDKESMGTLLIPNTVALIRGGPNPEAGKQFIDFLLSKEVEAMLAASEAGQIPLRPDVPRPAHVPSLNQVKAMEVDFEDVANCMESSGKFLQELFVR